MNWGTELPEDDIARVGLLDRTSLPWKDSLAATAENTFIHNPLIETLDTGLLASAKSPLTRSIIGNIGRGFSDMPAELPQTEPADAFQDPKSLNEQYGQTLGLTFDQPTRKGAVSIMVRRKQEEIARNALIERGPGGLAYGITSFATQLAVSASDPLNIASAFLPVVGESRAAIWAARYGKIGGRALTGAVEGAVGAAAIEPLNYASSKYLGDDYTMGDSLLNIALGSVLGGGLHAGFGAISDHLSRLAPETREGALRGAVANMAEGRPVEVGHIFAADPAWIHQADTIPTNLEDRPMFFTKDGTEKFYSDQKPEMAANLALRNPLVESQMDAAKYEGLRQQLTKEGMPEAAAAEVIRDMKDAFAHSGQFMAPEFQRAVEALGYDGMISDKSFRGTHAVAFHPPDQVLRASQPVAPGDRVAASNALDRARTNSLDYGKGAEPSTATAPREASANADRIVREVQGDDLAVEHSEAIAQIDKLEAQGALTPAEAEAGRSGAEDIKRANQQAKAAKAAAGCLLLHP